MKMGTVQREFRDRVPVKTTLLKRWSVTVDGEVVHRSFSAIYALAEAERMIKAGMPRVRFGWNLPTKKAQGCDPEPLEMAELIKNCGIREARKIMELEA
jgi:hypothetical protein